MRTQPKPVLERDGMPEDERRKTPQRLVSRRGFLGGIGIAGLLGLVFHNSIGRLFCPVAQAENLAAPAVVLGEHEAQTLTAFGRVLVPSAFASGAADTVIRATLDAHAGDLAFQAAVELLDQESTAIGQAQFVALDGERQRALVRRLLEGYTARTLLSAPYYYASEQGRRIRHLWSAVAKPIVLDFYTSPLGWQVVGYPRRPGECSNLVDYQDPIA